MAFLINSTNGVDWTKVYLPNAEYGNSDEATISEALRVACSGFLFGNKVVLN